MEKDMNFHNDDLIKEFHMTQIQENISICNCIVKPEGPVGGWCLTENTVYEAPIFPKQI